MRKTILVGLSALLTINYIPFGYSNLDNNTDGSICFQGSPGDVLNQFKVYSSKDNYRREIKIFQGELAYPHMCVKAGLYGGYNYHYFITVNNVQHKESWFMDVYGFTFPTKELVQ